MEVQLHVDVRMRQKAGFQTTKIKSTKSFVIVHPRKFIPLKHTHYTVHMEDVSIYMYVCSIIITTLTCLDSHAWRQTEPPACLLPVLGLLED